MDLAATLAAAALSAREPSRAGIAVAFLRVLGPAERGAAWELSRHAAPARPSGVLPPARDLAIRLRWVPGFWELEERLEEAGFDAPVWLSPPVMQPLEPLRDLGLPRIETLGALGDWLGLDAPTLDCLADLHGRATEAGPLCHYRRWRVAKRSGSTRVIEAPKARLKIVQRRILDGILARVPPHPAAFGFTCGRSARDGAARHVGEAVVLGVDLRDFFPSVRAGRVHAIYRRLGYPPAVARTLMELTTTSGLPDGASAREREVYGSRHLPQGAPSSPALANLTAFGLDRRLAGLARRLGAANSRYADDIAISGDRHLALPWVRDVVAEIVADEGFALAPAKTRIQGRGARQTVTGIVVNSRLNVPRPEVDRLKAILTNCVRHGPEGQNRTGHPDFRRHLEGRILWVESLNPVRGAKLRALFDRIRW